MAGPSIKVIRSRYRTTNTLRSPNRKVLVESRRALDGRCVHTLGLVDVVGPAVAVDGTFEGSCRAGVVVAVGLDDIVFHEGACGPAVEGEVAVSLG